MQIDADPIDLTAALRHYFGFSAFRAEQEEVVRRAVAGQDTLALMPTGAGKSLCYQLAAMLRPTPTLVVSPLIALMKDQIDNLPAAVATHASLINSSLDAGEAARRLRSLSDGSYKLIYAAPERLRQRTFMQALRNVDVGLVVVDEVHCVSMWGHDFRPDYLFIRSALEALEDPTVLGLTATATPATAEDISASLGRGLEVVKTSVVRPNLRYEVEGLENEEEKLRRTVSLARNAGGSGIVYARARERCERLAQLLRRNGVSALHYHAGLDPAERSSVQERFLGGGVRVIVATTAFGMGIDKPDIRWILLYNLPGSLEDYVQRVGRAGRDGQPSTCTLLVSEADGSNLRRFTQADIPTLDTLRAAYRALREISEDSFCQATPQELRERAGLSEESDPRVLVGMLERAGLVTRDYDVGPAMQVALLPPPPDTPRRIEGLLEEYAASARARADRMIAFAAIPRCRHLQVAEHFGERVGVPCGMCDVCLPGKSKEMARAERELPSDIAKTIIDAVDALEWPLGVPGLSAMLTGSIDAPPSAQRSPYFGALAAVGPGTVKCWIGGLVETGHLERYEDRDYRLLRVARRNDLPSIDAESAARRPGRSRRLLGERESRSRREPVELRVEDRPLFEALRAWRVETAAGMQVAPFVVASDRTLREIAVRRPTTPAALTRVDGIGPTKLKRYGDQILKIVASLGGS